MATDVFDEQDELKTTRALVDQVKEVYLERLGNSAGIVLDIDVRRRCTSLATHWPGDEVIRQVVFDILQIMGDKDLLPGDIGW